MWYLHPFAMLSFPRNATGIVTCTQARTVNNCCFKTPIKTPSVYLPWDAAAPFVANRRVLRDFLSHQTRRNLRRLVMSEPVGMNVVPACLQRYLVDDGVGYRKILEAQGPKSLGYTAFGDFGDGLADLKGELGKRVSLPTVLSELVGMHA